MLLRTLPRPAVLAATLLAGGASAACDLRVGDGSFHLDIASGVAQDEWTKSYTLGPGGHFEVRNGNGEIRIEPSPDAAVHVKAERRAKAATDEEAKALLAELRIEEQISQTAVVLETKAPAGRSRRGHVVKYTVRVPAGIAVRARTINGGVRLERLPNDAVVATENGGIHGEDLSGATEAETTNGGVDVTLRALAPGGVKLTTVNGGVQLVLPRTAKADISARCVNGGLSVGDLPVDRIGEQSRRRLDGKLNGGGARVELATTNGGIAVAGRGD